MPVARTRTFRSGNSQALRLPKEVAFGDDIELVLARSGDVLTVYPASLTVAQMVTQLNALPAPPTIEMRDREELPEREGL